MRSARSPRGREKRSPSFAKWVEKPPLCTSGLFGGSWGDGPELTVYSRQQEGGMRRDGRAFPNGNLVELFIYFRSARYLPPRVMRNLVVSSININLTRYCYEATV